jgi:hypothetical protein
LDRGRLSERRMFFLEGWTYRHVCVCIVLYSLEGFDEFESGCGWENEKRVRNIGGETSRKMVT